MAYTPPERTPPKPDPSITPTTMKGNYPRKDKAPPPPPAPSRPTRDSSRKRERGTDHTKGIPGFAVPAWLIRFIDWLNGKVGADKPKGKQKHTRKQMATLSELFDGVEESNLVKPKPETSWGTYNNQFGERPGGGRISGG